MKKFFINSNSFVIVINSENMYNGYKYLNMVQSSVLKNTFRHKSLHLNECRRNVHEETTWKN